MPMPRSVGRTMMPFLRVAAVSVTLGLVAGSSFSFVSRFLTSSTMVIWPLPRIFADVLVVTHQSIQLGTEMVTGFAGVLGQVFRSMISMLRRATAQATG